MDENLKLLTRIQERMPSARMSTCPAAGTGSRRALTGVVREVVRDLRRRKPDIASLAYFDAALADRHAKRAETPSERAGYAAVTDFDAVISMFVRTGVWSRYAGPEPGAGWVSRAAQILGRYGIDPATGLKMRKAG